MAQRNPADALSIVRQLSYRNREEEDAAIRETDEIVFGRVRQLEVNAVERAHRFMDAGRQAVTNASEVTNELEELRSELKKARGAVSPELAEKYEIVRNRARAAQQALQRHSKEADYHAGVCEDPWGAYVRMTERFPMLRPNLPW
jgi:hypothetical protein